jgi:glycosidase
MRGIVYQIFPDRFRDGQTANDPAEGVSSNTAGSSSNARISPIPAAQ